MNTPESTVRRIDGRGGYREGAGKPKGAYSEKTRTLIEVKNRIAQKADDIINAELIEALGAFIVLSFNETTLEFEKVTDPDEIKAFINEHKGSNGQLNGKSYIISTQQGNYKSRQYLLDRAFGRPGQTVEVKSMPDEEMSRIKGLIEYWAQQRQLPYSEAARYFFENIAQAIGIKPELQQKLLAD